MDLLCSINIWPVLTLLFQGAVAGLIVMLVTKRIDAKKTNELTRKHAILLYFEVESHLSSIKSILKTNGILEKSELEHLDTDVWRSSRCYLAELSTEELMRLAAYYRLVGTLNILIDLYPGVMPPQVRNHFEKGFLMAQAVLHLLGIYWDVKNVRCHVESYRQLFARIDREYLRCPP